MLRSELLRLCAEAARGMGFEPSVSFDGPVDKWRSIREEIHAEVLERGYHAGRNTFVQHYDGAALDALTKDYEVDGEVLRRDVAALTADHTLDGVVHSPLFPHVSGTAAIPLLLVKLWTVYPRLFTSLGRREGGAAQVFAAHLTKPVKPAQLFEALAHALARGSDVVLICVGYDRELRELLAPQGGLRDLAKGSLVAVLSLGDGMERFSREQIEQTTSLQAVSVVPLAGRQVDGVFVPDTDAIAAAPPRAAASALFCAGAASPCSTRRRKFCRWLCNTSVSTPTARSRRTTPRPKRC